MSRSVRFEIPNPGVTTSVRNDPSFIDTLERVFGELPLTLSDDDLKVLTAIQKIFPDEPGWGRLIVLIDDHQNIDVKEEF